MNSVIGTDKDGNDMELADTLAYEEKDIVDVLHSDMMMKKILKYVNENLEERERKIMIMRYGLDGREQKTQEEVAKELKISRSYVSRIETKLQKDLKKYIES